MDALSALKMVATPSTGGLPLNSLPGLAGSLTPSIPPAELQQLTGAMGGGLSPAGLQNLAASLAQSGSSGAVQQIGAANSDTPFTTAAPVSSGSGAHFENLLGDFVNDVAQKQAAAGGAVSGLLSGQNVSLHQAMISMEEANVSFQMMVEVRNRLLDGYQELMRMQV
jgi:flagellar hook-basal body complex protein FliE